MRYKHAEPPTRAGRRARLVAGLIAAAGVAALPLAVTGTASAAASPPALAGAGVPAFPGATPAASASSVSLTSGPVSITAGGHTWKLEVQLSKEPGGGPDVAEIEITTPHLGGQEIHDWLLDMPAADFTASTSAGTATVQTGTALSPVAALTLAFTPTSHTKTSCSGGGGRTTYAGTLIGTVQLVTGLDGLTLSKADASFSKPNALQVATGSCGAPSPCSYTNWSTGGSATSASFSMAGGDELGRPGHLQNYAELVRLSPLSKPAGERIDGALVKAKAPRFDKGKKSLSVTSSSAGIVTGSAVLHSAKSGTSATTACRAAGTSYRVTSLTYLSAKFASPAGRQFEAHTLLTGVIKIARSGQAEFSAVTKIKKKVKKK